MTAYQGTMDGTNNGQNPQNGFGGDRRSRRCGRMGWRPVELVAMILGFIVFWPVGLAILLMKMWQRREGYQGDLVDFVQERTSDMRAKCMAQRSHWGREARGEWRTGFAGPRPTGNSAFDDWRSAELARLEEERQKLVQAEREFAEHLDNLRRARDREEFERFMSQRNSRPTPPAAETGPQS